MFRSLRGSIILVLVTAFSATPWAAEGAQICPAGQAARLGTAFVALRERVGSAMGTPIECAHADRGTGNEYQQTTTGVAVYQHEQDAATFTNGHEFWKLGPDGLAQWSGWHGRAGPPVAAGIGEASDVRLSVASNGVYPKVQAGKVLHMLDGEQPRLVLEHDGKTFVVEVGAGCLIGQPPPSGAVFVISKNTFAEPSSRLVLRIGGRECLITASRTL